MLGVMFFTDRLLGTQLVQLAKQLEQRGVDTLWLPELFGREVFSTAGFLLARTNSLRVASGIANVYARDAFSARQAARGLAELSGGRFVLGLGVSNPQIAGARGHEWELPVEKLRPYLDAYAGSEVQAPAPSVEPAVYLAAHGPQMLSLARDRTDGASTYLMSSAHTAEARARLGPGKVLNVVQHCLHWPDGPADEARAMARRAVHRYMELDYYREVWRKLGFNDSDFEKGGSDRIVDTLVAWGDAKTIQERLAEHREAGADELIVVPLSRDGGGQEPDWSLLEVLA